MNAVRTVALLAVTVLFAGWASGTSVAVDDLQPSQATIQMHGQFNFSVSNQYFSEQVNRSELIMSSLLGSVLDSTSEKTNRLNVSQKLRSNGSVIWTEINVSTGNTLNGVYRSWEYAVFNQYDDLVVNYTVRNLTDGSIIKQGWRTIHDAGAAKVPFSTVSTRPVVYPNRTLQYHRLEYDNRYNPAHNVTVVVAVPANDSVTAVDFNGLSYYSVTRNISTIQSRLRQVGISNKILLNDTMGYRFQFYNLTIPRHTRQTLSATIATHPTGPNRTYIWVVGSGGGFTVLYETPEFQVYNVTNNIGWRGIELQQDVNAGTTLKIPYNASWGGFQPDANLSIIPYRLFNKSKTESSRFLDIKSSEFGGKSYFSDSSTSGYASWTLQRHWNKSDTFRLGIGGRINKSSSGEYIIDFENNGLDTVKIGLEPDYRKAFSSWVDKADIEDWGLDPASDCSGLNGGDDMDQSWSSSATATADTYGTYCSYFSWENLTLPSLGTAEEKWGVQVETKFESTGCGSGEVCRAHISMRDWGNGVEGEWTVDLYSDGQNDKETLQHSWYGTKYFDGTKIGERVEVHDRYSDFGTWTTYAYEEKYRMILKQYPANFHLKYGGSTIFSETSHTTGTTTSPISLSSGANDLTVNSTTELNERLYFVYNQSENVVPIISQATYVTDRKQGVEKLNLSLSHGGETDIASYSQSDKEGVIEIFSNTSLVVNVSDRLPVNTSFTISDWHGFSSDTRRTAFSETDYGLRDDDYTDDFSQQRANYTLTLFNNAGDDQLSYNITFESRKTAVTAESFAGTIDPGNNVTVTAAWKGDWLHHQENYSIEHHKGAVRYGYQVDPNYTASQYIYAVNMQNETGFSVNVSSMVDPAPANCTRTTDTVVDIPASNAGNLSQIQFTCDPGTETGFDPVTQENTSDYKVYNHTGYVHINSDVAADTQQEYCIPETRLDEFDSRKQSKTKLLVDGSSTNLSLAERTLGGKEYACIVIGTQHTNSSIHQGDHVMTLEYYVSKSTGSGGGGGGGSGGSGTGNQTVQGVMIRFQHRDPYVVPYGENRTYTFQVVNTANQVNNVTLWEARNQSNGCSYISIQTRMPTGKVTFGNAGLYSMKPKTQGLLKEAYTRRAAVQIRMPSEERFKQLSDGDQLECVYLTDASVGKAVELVVTAQPSIGPLQSLNRALQRWLGPTGKLINQRTLCQSVDALLSGQCPETQQETRPLPTATGFAVLLTVVLIAALVGYKVTYTG